MERLKKREKLRTQKNFKKNKTQTKNSLHRKESLKYNQTDGFFLKRDIQNNVSVDNCNTVIEGVNLYFNRNQSRFEVLYNEELLLYLLRFLPISGIINLIGTNMTFRHLILNNLKYVISKLDDSFPINFHFQIVFQNPDLHTKTFYDRVIYTYLSLTNKPKSYLHNVPPRVKACQKYLEGKGDFYHCQKGIVAIRNRKEYTRLKYHCYCHQITFSYFYNELKSYQLKENANHKLLDSPICYHCASIDDYCCCQIHDDYDYYSVSDDFDDY